MITGRSPAEVALFGRGVLPTPAVQPGQWSTGALVTLSTGKGLA
ncbi:hypothetical protein AB0K14_23380 [Actinosynnema sp. NPDC050801]